MVDSLILFPKILVFALEGTDDFGQCVGLLGLLRETVSAWDREN
jgi:hypothetical protein